MKSLDALARSLFHRVLPSYRRCCLEYGAPRLTEAYLFSRIKESLALNDNVEPEALAIFMAGYGAILVGGKHIKGEG
jgi:hypothetical protein